MADRRLLAAQAMLERERFADAERVARDVLASDPHDADAFRMLAMALTGQGHYDGAVDAMSSALGEQPDSAFNLYSLAYVHARRGDLRRAERTAREALEREPDDAATLRLLAHIRLAQGRPQSSLATADEALRLEPWRVRSYVARADALIALNRPHEALDMLHEAQRLEPDDADVYASLGTVEAMLDHHREAETAFREALRIDPALEAARVGLVVALKLRNPVYRALRGRFRFAFLFPVVLAIGLCAQWPRTYPAAVTLLLVGLPVFLFVDQVATVGIRFDRAGRRALTLRETRDSNLFLGSLAPVLAALAVWAVSRFDAAAFAAVTLGFAFLFVTVGVDRKPGRLRAFILGNALVWALASIVSAVALAATGSPDWSTDFARLDRIGGVTAGIADAAFIVLLLQLFVFGLFLIAYCYLDVAKSTLTRAYNRIVDRRRAG